AQSGTLVEGEVGRGHGHERDAGGGVPARCSGATQDMNVMPDEFEPGRTEAPFAHTTVMRTEVVEAIVPRSGGIYVDATIGGGGHAEAILEAAAGARLIGFDRDLRAVDAARERLAHFGERVTVVHACYSEIEPWLRSSQIDGVDGLVADLGVSSP